MAKLLRAYPVLPPACVGYARLCRSGGFQRRHILFFPFHRQWLELAGLVVEHPQHAFGDIEQGALQVQLTGRFGDGDEGEAAQIVDGKPDGGQFERAAGIDIG